MQPLQTSRNIHYVLRMVIAMCFIGHGAFGIITKPIWCNYFAVFGIGTDTAYTLMPWVGVADILLGVIMLVYPLRAIALWLVMWGMLTAFLRPASGEPFAEFIERAGNFGAPLAFILMSGGIKSFRQLFTKVDPDWRITTDTMKSLTICLKAVVFLLLLGHGWLNLMDKKALLNQYASLGFYEPGTVADVVGVFEVVAACTVFIAPVRSVLLILFIWKMSTELFYPHYELFEFIERGGSYGCILALWFALGQATSGSPIITCKKLLTTNY
jgi:hypothetical protein